MAYIYAFEPTAEDCSSIGLVGALLDYDAEFDLMAGEFGELSFEHPIDDYGKWQVLVNGTILKTMVPMRLCPGIKENGQYVTTVDKYTVARTATKNQRYIYSAKTKGKKKKLLKVGKEVTVVSVADSADPDSRYKVKSGKVSGWMEREGLTLTQQNIPVEPDESGLEETEPSYAVRQQLFRIYEVIPETNNNNPGSIRVFARRIAYDLIGNVTTYKANGSISCLTACEGILNNTLMPHSFSVYTDIGDEHVGFDANDKNPIEALVGPDDGVTMRWNAEVVSDDYDIYILRRAGLDRGVSIEYGKNLIGVEIDEDISNVSTAIRPKGETKDGKPLYLDGRISGGSHIYNTSDVLPEGYHFYVSPDDEVNGTIIVRSTFDAETALPRIYVADVGDAKVEKGSADITTTVARRMMVEEAVALFDGGCDAADVSMSVDFVMLGDTEEYAQYKHLEPLFVYDTVRVHDRRIGVYAVINLTRIRWLVRDERVSEADFGSLTNMSATISSWQITNINGGKIMSGTIGPAAIGEDSISADHVQANSINAQAIQAEAVTAAKLAAHAIDAQLIEAQQGVIDDLEAGTITTGTLAAKYAEMFTAIATNVETDVLNADDLTAALADIVSLTAQSAKFDTATVENLLSKVLIATRLVSGMATIENLFVTQANMGNLTLGHLTLLGADEKYYDIEVNEIGTLTVTEREVTQDEIDEGITEDGHDIVDASGMEDDPLVGYDVPNLNGMTVTEGKDGLMWVTAQALHVGVLDVVEAFIGSAKIPAIQATTITALSENLNLTANQTIQLLLGTDEQIRAWFSFTDRGLVVRKTGSRWSTRTAADGFYIEHDEVTEPVGAFHKELLEVHGLKVGRTDDDIICRRTSNGGWVWTD